MMRDKMKKALNRSNIVWINDILDKSILTGYNPDEREDIIKLIKETSVEIWVEKRKSDTTKH